VSKKTKRKIRYHFSETGMSQNGEHIDTDEHRHPVGSEIQIKTDCPLVLFYQHI
jgi:hypothetical protein